MGDVIVIHVDHETKRIQLDIFTRENFERDDFPYLHADFSPSELPSFVKRLQEGIEQEFYMLEAWEDIIHELALDVEEETP